VALGRAERRLRKLFARNHKLSTALLPRLESLMRRPRLRRALLAQVVTRGDKLPAAAAVPPSEGVVSAPRSRRWLPARDS